MPRFWAWVKNLRGSLLRYFRKAIDLRVKLGNLLSELEGLEKSGNMPQAIQCAKPAQVLRVTPAAAPRSWSPFS
jgi:hypothetical protein